MNFREQFEAWHKARYGYIGNFTGTAMNITYRTSTLQARWEGWQACADLHTQQEIHMAHDYRLACEAVGEDDHDHPDPPHTELTDALTWALAWIDAVPKSTQLPAMPGFDRDYVDALVAKHGRNK